VSPFPPPNWIIFDPPSLRGFFFPFTASISGAPFFSELLNPRCLYNIGLFGVIDFPNGRDLLAVRSRYFSFSFLPALHVLPGSHATFFPPLFFSDSYSHPCLSTILFSHPFFFLTRVLGSDMPSPSFNCGTRGLRSSHRKVVFRDFDKLFFLLRPCNSIPAE